MSKLAELIVGSLMIYLGLGLVVIGIQALVVFGAWSLVLVIPVFLVAVMSAATGWDAIRGGL